MCGIAGIINLSKRMEPSALGRLAERMANSMVYRGPDDSGTWVDPSGYCAFSHRRLSIIDLTSGGHQPMLREHQSAVTYNGEIYNFPELRTRLTSQGNTFKTSSDTEVLLAGLALDGIDFIDRMDAMFAFAHFDFKSRNIILARDIFGEKPLYYAQTKDFFAFASELQALTLVPDFDVSIDKHRIETYLALQYIPAPLTIYRGASKLLPGHTLTLTPDGHVSINKYFCYKSSPQKIGSRSLDDYADELQHVLTHTIRSRLIADVPLGAFLSGGVDSSTVVALAQQVLQQPIKTFSIGFANSDDSEHNEARAMAAHLNTEHHDEILSLDALELGKHIALILDEPNGDTSCLPTYVLSQMARKHVSVAISGDGGDELFGGYGRYQSTLGDEINQAGNPEWLPENAYYSYRIMTFPDATLEKFSGTLTQQSRDLFEALRMPLRDKSLPLLQRMRQSDIENYLPGAVLAKVDRMSMQHSLEVRAPLLGRAVAQFSMSIAANDLCVPGASKRVLKHLAQRYIPRAGLDRPNMGFGMPVKSWGAEKLAQEVSKLLLSPDCRISGWITPDRLKRFSQYHSSTPQTYQLWAVYILELWLRHHSGTVA
jgi:asparagine synthase (glutamine-hydrolysing)